MKVTVKKGVRYPFLSDILGKMGSGKWSENGVSHHSFMIHCMHGKSRKN